MSCVCERRITQGDGEGGEVHRVIANDVVSSRYFVTTGTASSYQVLSASSSVMITDRSGSHSVPSMKALSSSQVGR